MQSYVYSYVSTYTVYCDSRAGKTCYMVVHPLRTLVVSGAKRRNFLYCPRAPPRKTKM